MFNHNGVFPVESVRARMVLTRQLLAAGALASLLLVGLSPVPAAAEDGALSPRGLNVATVGYTAQEPVRPDPGVMPRHADERTVVDVTEFGADPTGKEDSAAPIADAFARARSIEGPVTISFPRGDYQIYPEDTAKRELYVSNTTGANQDVAVKNVAMLIEGMDDVIVAGHGSLVTFDGKQSQFAVIDSTDVTITGFGFDWYAPTTLDMTVVDTGVSDDGHGYRDIRLPVGVNYDINGNTATFYGEASPATGEPYWTFAPADTHAGWNQIRELASGHTRRSALPIWDGSRDVTELEQGLLRITYSGDAAPSDAGNVYEMRHTLRDHPGALIWQSERTAVDQVEFHYLHGFGIVGQLSEDVTFNRVTMAAKPGTWRQSASFADFIQMSSVAGTVQITNSLFDNPHDDPFNIHGTYVQVVGIDRENRQVKLRYMHPETAGFPQFYTGDTLQFVQKSTMLPAGSATVTAVDGPTGTDHGHDLRTMTATLDGELPEALAVGQYVAENLTYTPDVYIAGNTFRSVPTRGILVTTPGEVVIERNHFDQMNMASIYISADAASWYESGAVRDVTIRHNIFDRPSPNWPVIYVQPTNSETVPGRTVHSGIAIAENRFSLLPGGSLVGAKSVTDLAFTNNLVQHWAPTVPVTDVSGEALFSFTGSAEVTITGNTYADGFNLRAEIANMAPAQVTSDQVLVEQDNLLRPDVPRATFDESLHLVREEPATWSAVDADSIRLTAGANGLWATQNAATNLLMRDTAGAAQMTVEVGGATESGWEEVGLLYYLDDDNYVAVERKHDGGSPKLAVVTESAGRPNEDGRIADPGNEELWLRLTRDGESFTGSYSTDGQHFTEIRTVTNPIGARGHAGVIATGVSPQQTAFTLSGWQVDGAPQDFFSKVSDRPEPRLAAALAEVNWRGMTFAPDTDPLTALAYLGRGRHRVVASFDAAPSARIDQVLFNAQVVQGTPGGYMFSLSAGPNVIEVHTSTSDGRAQTYRWVIISDPPAAGSDATPGSRGQRNGVSTPEPEGINGDAPTSEASSPSPNRPPG